MKKYVVPLLGLVLFACTDLNPTPKLDVTLEPSQIAANVRSTPAATAPYTTPEPVRLSRDAVAQVPTDAVTMTPIPLDQNPTQPAQAETPTDAAPDEPAAPTPTSNAEELQAMTENPNLLASIEMDEQCFLENEAIPFRLTVTSLEIEPIYFYRAGKWLMSINNSPLGPQLASRTPTLREEFITLDPNESYTYEEEDLGFWVLSLGPQSGIEFTPSGLGLPVGEYWVTFMYTNDQDGLTEQPDGTYLIDKAAWRGTAVAPEVRFKVVVDRSAC